MTSEEFNQRISSLTFELRKLELRRRVAVKSIRETREGTISHDPEDLQNVLSSISDRQKLLNKEKNILTKISKAIRSYSQSE